MAKRKPRKKKEPEPVAKQRRRRRRRVVQPVTVTAEPETLMDRIFARQRADLDRLKTEISNAIG